MIDTFNDNRIVIGNVVGVWVTYVAAISTAIMPIFQLCAFVFATVVSILTIVKLLKDLFK